MHFNLVPIDLHDEVGAQLAVEREPLYERFRFHGFRAKLVRDELLLVCKEGDVFVKSPLLEFFI